MKRLLFLFSILAFTMSSCEDKRFQTYMANVPVYLTYKDLRSSFAVNTASELEKPGKIYFYGS